MKSIKPPCFLRNNMGYQRIHSNHGIKKNSLKRVECRVVKGYTYYLILKTFLTFPISQSRKRFVTPEFRVLNKKKILKDKYNFYLKIIKGTKSFRTLEVDLTGREKVLSPYWNEYTAEESKRLWLPTRIDCVDLGLNSLNGFVKNTTFKSKFTIPMKTRIEKENLPMTFSPLQTSSSPLTMGDGLQEIESNGTGTLKCRKIRIYPTSSEKKQLNQWFNASRFTRNLIVAHFKKTGRLIMKDISKKFINKEGLTGTVYNWMLNTSYDIRNQNLLDIQSERKGALKRGVPFEFKFQSRNNRSSVITIRERQWRCKKGEFSFLKHIKSSEPIDPHNSLKIQKIDDKYYVLLVMSKDKHVNTGNDEISLDPGVRDFLTGYSPNGTLLTIGRDGKRLLQSKWNRIDRLNSILKNKLKENHQSHVQIRRLKRAIKRTNSKITNIVANFHWQTCIDLCRNFKKILIPVFKTHQMVQKNYQGNKRKIDRNTTRTLQAFSHYKFRRRLIHKASEFGCNVIVCKENHTTQTCGSCGCLNKTIGSSRNFKCPWCSYECDRDVNAARNIRLRYLTLNKPEA